MVKIITKNNKDDSKGNNTNNKEKRIFKKIKKFINIYLKGEFLAAIRAPPHI